MKGGSTAEVDEETRRWAYKMWEIFDRGVEAAKAENERLGLTPTNDVYPEDDQQPSQKVAESGE